MVETQKTFWEFSLAFYANPEVQTSCLKLQNQLGADVNILLYLLYQASLGRQVLSDTISIIDKQVKHWREDVIQAIRHIRNQLKQSHYSLSDEQQSWFRKEVLTLELSAEKLEQIQLESLDIPFTPAAAKTAAEANINIYANYLGADVNPIEESDLSDFSKLIKHFQNQH